MASVISCKVLLALVICVSLGFEGISASTIRRQDWETSVEDLGEEGQNFRTARSAGRVAIFSSSNNGRCVNNKRQHPASSECYTHQLPTTFCWNRQDDCLRVEAYALKACRGEVVAYLDPNHRFSTPFTHHSLRVTNLCRNAKSMELPQYSSSQERSQEVRENLDAEEVPQPEVSKSSLGPLRWFQLRELQRMQRESRLL